MRSLVGRVARARQARFESRILWILGSPRSGSTWLLAMLAGHPRVIPIDEPLIGWFLGPFTADIPGVDPEHLDLDDVTLRGLQRFKRSQFFSDDFKGVWLPGLRRLIADRLRSEALEHPGRGRLSDSVIAVKEPSGSQAADVLSEATPRSRLLWLLRDGRDVVDSHLAASRRGSWLETEAGGAYRGISDAERHDYLVDTAYKWLWRTEVVERAFDRHGGPKLLMRYEELRAAPAVKLGELFEWLEVAVDREQLGELVAEQAFERLPAEQTGPLKFHRAATPGLWRENLSDSEQSALDGIIGPKLAALGYER